MTQSLVLIDSAPVRYASGASLYFAQGIPAGLLMVALPAWLTAQGVSAGDIGTYLAVITLPWAFKLLAGPFMDRFTYAAMGQRRPWILGAQFGLVLSLLALGTIQDPLNQMGQLIATAVLVNAFCATQDVAVDGMAIDLTPLQEQGRLNAFMSFGKAVGWAISSAVTGTLLVTFGMQVTATVAAAVVALLFLGFTLVRERQGEKRMPWSKGEAVASERESASFGQVFKDINQLLWQRASIVVLAIMFFDGLVSGYGHALMPVAAVKVFGFSTEQWSQLVAMMGLVGAGAALAMGPMIDRFGSKRMMIINLCLAAVHAIVLAQTHYLWNDSTYVKVMLAIWVALNPVVMVCSIALAMSICKSSASATQFAIYMSAANLGAAAGAKIFGTIAESTDYINIYMIMGGLLLVTVAASLFHRSTSSEDGGRKSGHTLRVGAGDAGVFFAVNIRCPRCHAGMEIIELDGVEIDRCTQCQGIWFDAGEVELLRNVEHADAIDVGSTRGSVARSSLRDSPCPRCGGVMVHQRDPDQLHIGFDSCRDCKGSFFDAGEWRDLTNVNLSDFFRKILMNSPSGGP